MSTHFDDPDRTPPQGIPRIDPVGGRHAAPHGQRPGVVDAWNAAEAQHRARRNQTGQAGPPRARPADPDPRVRPEPAAGYGGPEQRVRPDGRAHADETAHDDRFSPAAADPDGWSVAPAVIGGELPEAPPPPPRPVARQPEPAPDPAVKRSFLGKLFKRNG
ncbi:hypothetical protein FHS29_002323 [Saccharothrix tamanrassetensis]|uniref:Uncharacterized protein n=1 Tax=Saccharothrix tamanrassetensis TaxID=1051531 RepID=A0A841CB47_9PSEU|nr:hypothetical protein [Saccharothrix tamanrassetensis]MBB5955742.1 hypothetical protein [Saccharothrix tamanrassetensis]